MKVVAINGSPRKGGNTEIMLGKVLETLEKKGVETKLIQIGGTNIHGCRGCWACKKLQNRKCAFNECLAYHDGTNIHYFYGKHPGNLSEKIQGLDRAEKWSDLWYIFKPKGFDTTLAEMDSEERENRRKIDGSVQAMQEFAKWYENQ